MPTSNITTAEPGVIISNASSVADRENRFNYQSGFIHPAFTLTDARMGEDVLASDVLAFDVRLSIQGVTLVQVTSVEILSLCRQRSWIGAGLTSGTAIGTAILWMLVGEEKSKRIIRCSHLLLPPVWAIKRDTVTKCCTLH